ncbi:MAG: hypothetical protein OCD00_19410 [Colwellia sp.]
MYYQLFILLVNYFIASSLVALFVYIKSKKQYDNIFITVFITSLISILLLPLFLNALGNDSIKTHLGENYQSMELFSYVLVAALAGNTIIKKVLSSFDIDPESIHEIEKQQKNIINNQKNLSKGLLIISEPNTENIKLILSLLNKFNAYVPLEKIGNVDEKTLNSLKNSNYVSTSFNMNETTYRITALGKDFLKEL